MKDGTTLSLNCKGNLIDVSMPKVMGILNLTPDSFFDGGKHGTDTAVLKQVERFLKDGATFVDIGAYSSRPDAKDVSETEELNRILGSLEKIVANFPEALISIDTFRSQVASACLERGAAMINDISGGAMDAKMLDVVAHYQVPYIVMHMRGTPQNMAQKTDYDDVTIDVMRSLSQKVLEATTKKVNDIIIDPGFGFAKTLEQNYELLNRLDLFQSFELPLLVGISRKSMIYKLLKTSAKDALNGTTALNTIALLKGANILRVHDVKEAMECVQLVGQLRTNG
ncbi:MAG: dihydropteroate synthase [Allomuricauda sp.]|nr:MAG: dihydropteroate synthase [Allomuricauda sp.]